MITPKCIICFHAVYSTDAQCPKCSAGFHHACLEFYGQKCARYGCRYRFGEPIYNWLNDNGMWIIVTIVCTAVFGAMAALFVALIYHS